MLETPSDSEIEGLSVPFSESDHFHFYGSQDESVLTDGTTVGCRDSQRSNISIPTIS